MRLVFYISAILFFIITVLLGQFVSKAYFFLLLFVVPYIALGLYDVFQTGSNILRNYPIVGHFKIMLVENREALQDWILENELDVRPFDRVQKGIAYDRAEKNETTVAFGTRYNYYESGYEWMLHSTKPERKLADDLRINVGGKDCKQPYSSSVLNVSGMSYGSISDKATMALNGGAKLGGFASNTGEGGLTEFHLHYGGDLIFQFGTGYYGCRDKKGNFSEEEFVKATSHPVIKMTEIKISQGAKPGFGAILPGKKVNATVAKIRGVERGKADISPGWHTAFNTPTELMQFVQRLRILTQGRPVGYKFCLGQKHELFAMCKAMMETGITPDFITIDGGEGGTGAAHFESANSIGMPLEDTVPFVHNVLRGFGLRDQIKIYVSGKVTSAFHIAKYMALGADACNSARGMMFALGCVQALRCNKDTCPTGVTTTNPRLTMALVPEDKKVKVFNFHKATMDSLKDMILAAGLTRASQLDRSLFCRRTGLNEIKTLDEIFPLIEENCFFTGKYSEEYERLLKMSSANTFGKV